MIGSTAVTLSGRTPVPANTNSSKNSPPSKLLARDPGLSAKDTAELIHRRPKAGRRTVRRLGVIKEDDYPKLLTLKLAGRRNAEIAQMFDVPTEHILPHITRAMTKFRDGDLEAEHYAVSGEVKQKEKEKAFELAAKLDSAIEKSAAVLREISSAYGTGEASPKAELPSTDLPGTIEPTSTTPAPAPLKLPSAPTLKVGDVAAATFSVTI